MADSYEFLKTHRDRIVSEQRTEVEHQRDELLAALRRICVDDYGPLGGRIVKGNAQIADAESAMFYKGYNAGIEGQFNKTRDIAAAAIAKAEGK